MKSYDLGRQFTRGFSNVSQFSRNLGFRLSRFGSDLVRLSKNDGISAGNGRLLGRRAEPTPEGNPKRPEYVFDPNAEHKADVQIFEGLISLGDLIVWVGREKHRKSNLILQCAICAALGRNFLNFAYTLPKAARVVIIDYESKAVSLQRRYEAICKGMALSQEARQQLKDNLRIIDVRRSYQAGDTFPRFPANAKTSQDTKAADAFWTRIKEENPADLYVIDPMRSMHGEDENDSRMEKLLIRLRHFFGGAAVVIAHHMTKAGVGQYELHLKNEMRAWSDGARGSGAIKAHADVIVCQERMIEDEAEKVYWGAFLRDGADVEPIPLIETEQESFYWAVSREVPEHLKTSHEALKKAGGRFHGKAEAVDAIRRINGTSRSTAYRHVTQMFNAGLLVVSETGDWLLST